MEYMGITGVAGIVVICYLVGLIVKATPYDNNKIIPIVCGIAGGVLGVAGIYLMPDFPASDPITAVAVGIVSGLAATGADQIVKQVKSNTQ